MAGLAHPFSGLDHLFAMIAMGLWAGCAGGRALWAWPAAFMAILAAGALVGHVEPGLPGIDPGIALSVLALGALIALKASPPLAVGAAICAAFAFFHGHAHGAELPAGADLPYYAGGFVLATGLLHAVGVALGSCLTRAPVRWLPPLTGSAIAVAGLLFLAR